MANYFIDTEFNDRGHDYPVRLISLALVADDARELYFALPDSYFGPETCNEFVKKNVLPKIEKEIRTPVIEIANAIIDFIGADPRPKFWGYHQSQDFLLFRNLFTAGRMPPTFPRFFRELVQFQEFLGWPKLPKKPEKVRAHHALVDALWLKSAHEFLSSIVPVIKGLYGDNLIPPKF